MRRVAVVLVAVVVLAACSDGDADVSTASVPTGYASTTSTTVANVPTTTTVPTATTRVAGRPPPTTRTATPAPVGGASIAGCPLFPADNAWRRDVSKDPVHARSAAWVASIGGGGHLHPDFGSNPEYGIPYVVVPAAQPKVPVTFTDYGDESDPGPYPIPANAPVEAGGDHHVLVASGDCHLYELYNAARDGQGGWTASSGAVFDLRSNRLRTDGWTSADAAGLPIIPGLVRFDEIAAGRIEHALRFTVSRTQRGFIHPATHQAGATDDANVPPMGARFRLRASFDISRFTGASRIVLEALRRYGMLLADNGSNWFISGATDGRWNDDDLEQLKTVPGSAFEAVESGPVLR